MVIYRQNAMVKYGDFGIAVKLPWRFSGEIEFAVHSS